MAVADSISVRARERKIAWTGKLTNAMVARSGERPRLLFEQVWRGNLKPKGISRSNLPFAQAYAGRMIRIYRKYEAMDMTSEERLEFETALMKFKDKPLTESFATLSLDVRRVEKKVDQVLTTLNERLPRP